MLRKSVFTIIALILFSSLGIQAQNKLHFGLTYGTLQNLEMSEIYQLPYITIQPIKGSWFAYTTLETYNEHSFGALATYSLNSNFDLNLGFNYVRKYVGINFYGTNIGSGWLGNVFRTFEIPFSCSFKKSISKHNNIQLITSLGGAVDILNYEYIEFFQNKSKYIYLKGTDYYGFYLSFSSNKRTIPALIAGIGILNDFEKYGKLQIGLTMHYNPVDNFKIYIDSYERILNEEDESPPIDKKINSSYLSIYLKYYLPWGLIKSKE